MIYWGEIKYSRWYTMLEAFYLNTFFLFVQILISLSLIWLCNREDEEDDEGDIFVKSYFKNKFKLNFFIELFFILIGFVLLLINIAGVDVGIFLNSKNKDSFSIFQFYIGLSMILIAFNFVFNSICLTALNRFKYRKYRSNRDKNDDDSLLSKYYIRSLFF